MKETMVNGMKFKVWSDTTKKATFAESEDGTVKTLTSGTYISNDLTVRKAIANAYQLPTFRKKAVKATAEKITVIETQKAEQTQADETAEVETEKSENQQKEVRAMKYTIQELKDIYFEAKDRFGYIEDEDIMGYGNIAKKAERVLTGKTKFCRFNICEKDTISEMFTEDDDACIVNDTYKEYAKRYGEHAELVMKMYGVKKTKAQATETEVKSEIVDKEESVEMPKTVKIYGNPKEFGVGMYEVPYVEYDENGEIVNEGIEDFSIDRYNKTVKTKCYTKVRNSGEKYPSGNTRWDRYGLIALRANKNEWTTARRLYTKIYREKGYQLR